MGENTNDIFDTLADTGDDFESAITALTTYFMPATNTDYETYMFRKTKQNASETLDQYNTRLRKMATNCGFTNIEKEIRAQIIIGCTSHRVRKHALQTPSITLTELVAYGRVNETAEKHAKEIENETGSLVNAIDKQPGWIQRSHNVPKRPIYRKQQQPDKSNTRKCTYCNGNWHLEGLNKCKARGQTCNNCGKINHFASACLQKTQTHPEREQPRSENRQNRDVMQKYTMKQRNSVNNVIENSSSDDQTEYLYINQMNNKTERQHMVSLNVLNRPIKFLIDSGATIDILNKLDYDSIQPSPKLLPTTTNVYAYGSIKPIKMLGTIQIKLKNKGEQWTTTLHVTEEPGPSLLGKTSAENLKLIQFLNTLEEDNTNTIINKYSNLFKGIGKHNQIKVTLHIDETVKPTMIKHRRIPFHLRCKVEQELKDLEAKDIIEKVPTSEATPWVSPIVIIPKKTSDIRICVDMRQANKAIQRERHPTPTIDDVIYDLNGATVFSKLDLSKGYHQLELNPASRHITTFSTHIGLYRYKRLNFGVNAAAEIFQNAIAQTLQGIEGSMNVSDDILVFGPNQEQHDKALEATLQRLQLAGLTLNESKCILNKHHLNFLGYIFSEKGIAPDPEKIEAITSMSRPTTPTEIRSFLGMVNFCTRFIPNLASLSKPLRQLTIKNTPWEWKEEQNQAFKKIKSRLAQATNLAYFDKKKKTEIWTDASPTGLGAILIQRDKDNKEQILAFASHALSPTESRYSQIEREALAVTWAIEHFRIYVLGSRFQVTTDHKPLIPLYNNPNSQPSARLERWRLRVQQYSFEVTYRPGKENPADYMSRHPQQSKTGASAEQAADKYINFLSQHTTPKAITLEEINEHTLKDITLQNIIHRRHTGKWSEPVPKGVDNTQVQAFKKIRWELSTNKEGSILLRGARLIIPKMLQQRAVDIAHLGHLGITKTKAIIREKTWFTGIDQMIENTINQCIKCNRATNTDYRAPLQPTELPQRPWQRVNIDHKGPLPTGEYLLVIVDQFSRFPIVEIVKSTSASVNIPALDNIFSTFGNPEEMYTDNGPPFNGREFKQFAENLNIKHHKITPVWPQANGEVERFNKTMSKILKIIEYNQINWKQQLNHHLRSYRSSPHCTTAATPAELLFGYKIRTQLPDSRQLPIDHDKVKERDSRQKDKARAYHDQRYKQNHKPHQIGDTVLVKQQQRTKTTPPYRTDPYVITDIKGSMISAETPYHRITRNQSHFKVIPKIEIKEEDYDNPEQDDDSEISTKIDHNCDTTETQVTEQKYNLRRQVKPPTRLIEEI